MGAGGAVKERMGAGGAVKERMGAGGAVKDGCRGSCKNSFFVYCWLST